MPGVHHGLAFLCAKVELSGRLGWAALAQGLVWALVRDGFPLKVMLK